MISIHSRNHSSIQFVHLLLSGGNKDIAVRPFLNLGLEGAGGIEVEHQIHILMVRSVVFADFRQRFLHGGGGKNHQLYRTVSFRAAGGQGSQKRKGGQKREKSFHVQKPHFPNPQSG